MPANDLPPRRTIYKGTKLDLALQPVRLRDGTIGDREVVVHRGAVALLPMLGPDRVCLIRNLRHSLGVKLLEIPAGTIDEGESPESTAGRELQEETGFRAGRITSMGSWWVSPGVMTERMYLFLCEDLAEGPTDHQADEEMENVIVSWEEAVAMAIDGRIDDAKTKLAILLYDRERSRA